MIPQNAGLILRRVGLAIWLGILLACLSYYIYDPAFFTAQHIADFLVRFGNEILFVYLGLSIVRGFTLLPSTPLVIAGTLVFPDRPILVMVISLVGILLSSSMIYYFSELLGFSDYFDRKQPKQTHRIRRQLEKPSGLFFVFLWAFFPLVPTDAVCYVAGTIRMTFWKFIAAVFLGEVILCSFYIFFGGHILQILT